MKADIRENDNFIMKKKTLKYDEPKLYVLRNLKTVFLLDQLLRTFQQAELSELHAFCSKMFSN